jgi:hypothetical protein
MRYCQELNVAVFETQISNLHKNVLGVFLINTAHFKHGEPGLHEEHEEHANAVEGQNSKHICHRNEFCKSGVVK